MAADAPSTADGAAADDAPFLSREAVKRQSGIAIRQAQRARRRHETETSGGRRLMRVGSGPHRRDGREEEAGGPRQQQQLLQQPRPVASLARLLRSASASPANISIQLAVLHARGVEASALPSVDPAGGAHGSRRRLASTASAGALVMGTRPLV